MRFLLTLVGPDGQHGEAIYDTADSGLVLDGEPVPITEPMNILAPEVLVSPSAPGHKHGPFRRLRLQIGLACNMACAYCLQEGHRSGSLKATVSDAEHFLETMSGWWNPAPDEQLRIELWGGEPLLNWPRLRVLVEGLRTRHPKTLILIVTNGTLLSMEKARWLQERGIHLSISHDGPGHERMRGKDPLEVPKALEAIRWLASEHPDQLGFNCVLTADNYSLGAIYRHIAERASVDRLSLGTEGLVQIEGAPSLATSPVTDMEHDAIRLSLLEEIVSGEALLCNTVALKIRDIKNAIASGRPLSAVSQRCGMDRQDQIAVDLGGNVLTCQNTTERQMHIGHVSDLPAARLTTSKHFTHRPDCMACPVVHLCRGGCMYAEGQDWEATCRNSFTFNSAILSGAVYQLTGKLVTHIQEESRR